ncbi:MAG: MFS transporter [Calditrichota bacterium]
MNQNLYLKNIPKVLAINATWMFVLVMPIVVPFLKSHQLGMQAVYELQAFYAICVVLLEIPSGYLSDLVGRKQTLVFAGAFNGIGMGILAIGDSYWWFMVFELTLAIAGSLISGSDIALIYDSLDGTEMQHEQEKEIVGKNIFYSQMAETLAALAGGALAFSSLQLPVQVNAVTGWLPFIIALTLQEPPRKKMSRKEHGENFRHVYAILFRGSKLMRFTILGLVFSGTSTLIGVWAFQGYWEAENVPIYYFGYLWALFNFAVASTARAATFLNRYFGRIIMLWLIALLPVAGYFGMSVLGGIFGILAGLLLNITRGLATVLLRDDLNQMVEGDIRATANSVTNLGVRLNFALMGPLVGAVIDSSGYSLTFAFLAALFAVLLLLIFLPLLRMAKSETNPKMKG